MVIDLDPIAATGMLFFHNEVGLPIAGPSRVMTKNVSTPCEIVDSIHLSMCVKLQPRYGQDNHDKQNSTDDQRSC